MPTVVSTAGATEITHEGTTYVADETGVFDLPEEVLAEIGRLNDLVDAAAHFASREADRLAEALKPEALHARIVALEEQAAGGHLGEVEKHIASLVEKAVAEIEAKARAVAAKPARKATDAKSTS